MLRHETASRDGSESDGESAQQQLSDTSVARSPTPDNEESHQNVLVTVPPLGKTVFVTWNEFHEYLAEYQQRTYQIYSVRTATPVSTRNKRISEKYAKRGIAVPTAELLPEEMGTYSKAVVCTHHGRPRSRATGVRARQPSRAINCPAQITLVLRKDYTSGKCFVHVSSHTTRHNHALSDGQYRRHPMIRKITDPSVLRTVHTLQKANVEPTKILKYVREHTDKEVMLRDVHNMLASFRKTPPLQSAAMSPDRTMPPPVGTTQPRLSMQTAAPLERPPQFSGSVPPLPLAPARENLTQYEKFLAAFHIGKEISELMAEMEPDCFVHSVAELRMFLSIAQSGRVPVVTTRDAVEHMLTGIPNTPIPQQQAFQLAIPRTGPAPNPSTGSAAVNGGPNSLISSSQLYSSQ